MTRFREFSRLFTRFPWTALAFFDRFHGHGFLMARRCDQIFVCGQCASVIVEFATLDPVDKRFIG